MWLSGPDSRIAIVVLAVWVALSATLIIFNAALLGSYRHPVLLTCWHQFVSVVLIVCIRVAFPKAVATGDEEKGVPALTLCSAIWLGLPVAVCQSIGLVCGNTAIMYLSVAFCQMIKAFTPACVYASGCVLGTQNWSMPIFKCLCVITIGLVITSIGELSFHLFGFVMQLLALLTEGLRLTLLEVRLKSQGYKLNALSSVMVFAPMVCITLFVSALLFDRSAFDLEQINEIGGLVFGANAGVAFLLNVSIYLAIQYASGLVFTLAGIIKDLMIVAGGCIFQGQSISVTQMLGYTVAMLGLQAYGIVSRSPADFDEGVLTELLRRAIGGEKEENPLLPVKDSVKDLSVSISPKSGSTEIATESSGEDEKSSWEGVNSS